MNYAISLRAKADLAEIWEYTMKHWSVKQADIYINVILEACKVLSGYPEMGKVYTSLEDSRNYRGFPVKSHVIIYRVDAEMRVRIVRILHQRMDLKENL